MVVQRSALEHAAAGAVALTRIFEPTALDHHAGGFHHEHATDYDQQQLLLDHDREHSDGPSQPKAAGIAHEELGGMAVVPEKAEA